MESQFPWTCLFFLTQDAEGEEKASTGRECQKEDESKESEVSTSVMARARFDYCFLVVWVDPVILVCVMSSKQERGTHKGKVEEREEEDDDVEWYRQEVGVEPDPG